MTKRLREGPFVFVDLTEPQPSLGGGVAIIACASSDLIEECPRLVASGRIRGQQTIRHVDGCARLACPCGAHNGHEDGERQTDEHEREAPHVARESFHAPAALSMGTREGCVLILGVFARLPR